MSRLCACPSWDASECVRRRYGYSDRESFAEPCECLCHEVDGDEDVDESEDAEPATPAGGNDDG